MQSFINNRKLLFLLVIIGVVAAISLLIFPGDSSAHELRDLEDFQFVFGWRDEPALTNTKNGPEVFIRLLEGAEGDISELLADMEVDLRVEVSFGPETTTLDLRQDFRDNTHYIADLIPTRPGDYSFRVLGTIGDSEIDETFTSADGEFSSVEPVSDIAFPVNDPTNAELLERIEALEAELEALRAQVGE